MMNPGKKMFQRIELRIDVWVDPEKTDAAVWAVADNVAESMKNACDAAAKEIEAPDHGIEVVVR